MGMVVPNVVENEILTAALTPALTLRLYSSDTTPIGTTLAAAFIEVVGGGYANKPLIFANWGIIQGNPTTALYNAVQTWTFTGPTNAPAVIYGYYVTRNSDGKLMWAERFAAGVIPFAPILGSIIKVTPRFTAQSLF